MGSPIFYIGRATAPESQTYKPETVALVEFTTTADRETKNIVQKFCQSSNQVSLRTTTNKGDDDGGKGNGKWIKTLVGAGLLIGGAVGLYLVYKTGQTIQKKVVGAIRDWKAIEREVVAAIRGWKEAGCPALVNFKCEKIGGKFSIY